MKIGDRVIRLQASVKEEEQYLYCRGRVVATHPLAQNTIDVEYDHNHYTDPYCSRNDFDYEVSHLDKHPIQT